MARSTSPLRRYATPRALKASASCSPFSWSALITDEQPSMRCVGVAASAPSHHRCSCWVCAATDDPAAANVAESSVAALKRLIAASGVAQRNLLRCSLDRIVILLPADADRAPGLRGARQAR